MTAHHGKEENNVVLISYLRFCVFLKLNTIEKLAPFSSRVFIFLTKCQLLSKFAICISKENTLL